MSKEPVFRKNGRDGKVYLSQAYGNGYVSIEIDDKDSDMQPIIEDAIKNNDLSELIKYRREKKV